jgi:hypothetical protein
VKLAPGRARPLSPEAFVLALPEALHAVEALDADEDGFDNGEELMAGSEPANADSTPRYSECTPAEAAEAAKNGCAPREPSDGETQLRGLRGGGRRAA